MAELPTLPVASPGVAPQRQVRKTRVLQFRSLTLPLTIGWAPKEVVRGRYVTFREGMYMCIHIYIYLYCIHVYIYIFLVYMYIHAYM